MSPSPTPAEHSPPEAARPRPFCSDVSRDNDEPLHATASRIDDWFLIEYRGLWGRDAVATSGLTDQVKQYLREQLAAVPHGRLLFVRRPTRRRAPGLLVYAAHSREGAETLRRFELDTYEDLREVDLRADGTPVDHPLFLVCTHGKHDPCCARYGRPLYEALRDELEDEWVWQSTHVGGDRFAGNLVCLPHGLYYGRVDRSTALQILDEQLAGRIAPSHYRGRSAYTFAVQAAEREIRLAANELEIDAVRLAGVRRGEDVWRVAFRTRDAVTYEAEVTVELGDLTFLTCGAEIVRRPRRFVATPR